MALVIHSRSQVAKLGCDSTSPLAGLIKANADGSISNTKFYVTAEFSLLRPQRLS